MRNPNERLPSWKLSGEAPEPESHRLREQAEEFALYAEKTEAGLPEGTRFTGFDAVLSIAWACLWSVLAALCIVSGLAILTRHGPVLWGLAGVALGLYFAYRALAGLADAGLWVWLRSRRNK
jgi:hypothetical protein